ncbi:head decoration protein [Brevibacillus porteri]|uniref:head decoration protein n=1 Tax=Brevibacillus porteri TaxID=2126350 RepID=UPI003D1AD279
MAKLINNVGSFTPDNLFAGQEIPALVKFVKLKGLQGVVKRGTVLGVITASGLAVPVDSSKTDGSQTANAILIEDIDTSAGDAAAEAYESGHFNRKALIFGGTDTADKHETKLRELGIFLSDNIAY